MIKLSIKGEDIDTKKIIQRTKVKYLIFFLILVTITFYILDFIKKSNRQIYLNETTIRYTKAYNTIYTQYKELSEVIFSGILNLTKLNEDLQFIDEKSKIEQNQIRSNLYIQTFNRFNALKPKYITNIEYVLPDNSLFLSMRNPLDYGYKVSDKNIVLKIAHESKKAQNSYEVCPRDAGFKFIYPIIVNDKYLGAVNITFSEQAIASSMMKQYDVITNAILREDIFDKKFLKENETYQIAHFPDFLHNKYILREIQNVTKMNLSDIKPDRETSKILYELGMKKSASSYFVDKNKTVVTIIPILHNITNQNLGFISILSKGNTIGVFNDNYFTIFTLFMLLYLALILLFLQQKIKILLDKERIKEMIQKDKQILEQAKLAQMGEMIGNIAHQWRQPLSAISTVASGLKLNYEYKMLDQEDIPRQMDLIVENTKYLSNTIDTFRDFIKEEKVEKEVIVQDKLDECLKIVSASVENHHIKLINKIDYENPCLVKMVLGELSQVIINLINNSKDAIVQNKIKDGWIKISQTVENNQLLICIEDNGGGIKDDIITKIFDPYFTTKHQYQGTGLGLYMSKIIIEKHLKGKLEASNTQTGVAFLISLNLKND